MRHINNWVIAGALVLGLLLILASLSRLIRIALPLAVVLGLGIPAALLLWEHRTKLQEILGARQGNH